MNDKLREKINAMYALSLIYLFMFVLQVKPRAPKRMNFY